MPKRFGLGSNSFGQFYYGTDGFLYKKNTGVGARRSTMFAAGGNTQTNTHQYLYNKFKPGAGGVGASSIATRRAKNRLATVCNPQQPCGNYYTYLGRYNPFLYNPNGYIPTPQPPYY